MYYHVQLDIEDVSPKSHSKKITEIDIVNIDIIRTSMIRPFLLKERFMVDGFFIDPERVKRFVIKETEKSAKEIAEIENNTVPDHALIYIYPEDILDFEKYSKDITKELFLEVKYMIQADNVTTIKNNVSNRIFIVHGHNEVINQEVARTIERLGLDAIILREQPNSSQTIIEKFEGYANSVNFAIILLTADDKMPEKESFRARQNVIFEMGYFMGSIGRQNVMCLLQDNVEKPGDIDGVVYTSIDKAGVWRFSIVRELKARGYNVDANALM